MAIEIFKGSEVDRFECPKCSAPSLMPLSNRFEDEVPIGARIVTEARCRDCERIFQQVWELVEICYNLVQKEQNAIPIEGKSN